MRLVDDVDLVLTLGGREPHLLAQIAHLVDAPVARGVDLDEVEEASFADRDACRAGIARLAVRGLRAVDRLRDQTRDRGLADAARTGEKVGVSDLTGGDGIAEGADDVLLADHFVESLGTPAS